MGLGDWTYKRKIAQPMNDAADRLIDVVRHEGANPERRPLLEACVGAAGGALFDFALVARRLVKVDAGEGLMADFVAALPDERASLGALRVATWTVVARIPRSRLSPRYPDAIPATESALGIKNEWEQRIAHFRSTAADEAGELLQFNRLSLEGVVAGATGQKIEKAIDAFSISMWAEHLGGAVYGLAALMDETEPQAGGGFARLSEVEAEIKARKAQESESAG